MEEELKRINNELFELKQFIAQSQNYSENVQASLWDSESKQKEKNRDLSNSTNNVSNNLFNYQYSNNSNLSDTWFPKIWHKNEYCIFNNTLWMCLVTNSTIPSEGAEWKRVNLAEMLIDLSNRLSKLESEVK